METKGDLPAGGEGDERIVFSVGNYFKAPGRIISANLINRQCEEQA